MRLHIVALPHTQTTREYSSCAYTQKVMNFSTMMHSLGHETILYASEDNDGKCTELVTCITKDLQRKMFPGDWKKNGFNIQWDPAHPHFMIFNSTAAEEMKKRIQPGDVICLIMGLAQKPVSDAFPDNKVVEFGVGYEGIFAKYKVFESYAWMHVMYGKTKGAFSADGDFNDTVIPNYFNVADFPFSEDKDDYFLYVGRLIDRKGIHLASAACRKAGVKLILAGSGDAKVAYGDKIGHVDIKKRGELMSRAQGVFVPTMYLEPFGGVAAEAMLCGTPILTTDFGAFTENNLIGITGYRCSSVSEFAEATSKVKGLNPHAIRDYAVEKFGMDTVRLQYEQYLQNIVVGQPFMPSTVIPMKKPLIRKKRRKS